MFVFDKRIALKKKMLFWGFPGGPVVKTQLLPNAAGWGLFPGQGTRSHMPQLKIPRAATETQGSQIN